MSCSGEHVVCLFGGLAPHTWTGGFTCLSRAPGGPRDWELMSKNLNRTLSAASIAMIGAVTFGAPAASAAELCRTDGNGITVCQNDVRVPMKPVTVIPPAPTPGPVTPPPISEPPGAPVTPTPSPAPVQPPTPSPAPVQTPTPSPAPEVVPTPTPSPVETTPAPTPPVAPAPAPVQQFSEFQPLQPVGPSLLPPGAPLPEPSIEEVIPVEVPPPAEKTAAPAKPAPAATPSARPSPSATPTPSASATSSAEPMALERTDSQQGPNLPLLAGCAVVILGCLFGLAKVIGLPRAR